MTSIKDICASKYSAVAKSDAQLFSLLTAQAELEASTLKLIPSENFVDDDILQVNGSILTNKYSEGYPGARYYEGNEIIDQVESLAIERAKKLFGAEHANVQAYSGAPANHAAYQALMSPGDKLMGMPVPSGGHLTHGWKVNFSGIDYVPVHYGVNVETGLIDLNHVRDIALKERPKVIVVGATAYPRQLDYKGFSEIATEVGAYLLADIAHINGLIIAGLHPNPVPYCDVITSTTHKMLRGPRAALILSRIQDKLNPTAKQQLAQRIDRMVFPRLQAGPHMHTVAAIALALKNAASEEYKAYAGQIISNASTLAKSLLEKGYKLVTGGTDNHLMILDLRDKSFTGKEAAKALARAGLIANFNTVPGDPRSPAVTSGVRLGTPALTTMGMREPHMQEVALLIDRVLTNINNDEIISDVRLDVAKLCQSFTIPGITTCN
jgi:glycine hydroxymethyltransferase